MSEETLSRSASDAAGDPALAGGLQRDKDAFDPTKAKPKRRRKVSYLTANKIDFVDFKEINILRRFLNDRGKIVPARQSGNTASQQRMVARAIRRAREMALLPFVVDERTADRSGLGRRERPARTDRPDRPDRTESSEE